MFYTTVLSFLLVILYYILIPKTPWKINEAAFYANESLSKIASVLRIVFSYIRVIHFLRLLKTALQLLFIVCSGSLFKKTFFFLSLSFHVLMHTISECFFLSLL